MSDTPRTDEEWYNYPMSADCHGENHNVVRLKYARQLERELIAAKEALTQLYLFTEGYADGAPDASSHDKLCNEISAICKPFVTIL